MKKIIAILLFLIPVIGFSQGSFTADGDLAPSGNYPIVKGKYVKGQIKFGANNTVRDNIPTNFRDTGMLFFNTTTNLFYVLQGTLSNSGWQPLSTGTTTYTMAQIDSAIAGNRAQVLDTVKLRTIANQKDTFQNANLSINGKIYQLIPVNRGDTGAVVYKTSIDTSKSKIYVLMEHRDSLNQRSGSVILAVIPRSPLQLSTPNSVYTVQFPRVEINSPIFTNVQGYMQLGAGQYYDGLIEGFRIVQLMGRYSNIYQDSSGHIMLSDSSKSAPNPTGAWVQIKKTLSVGGNVTTIAATSAMHAVVLQQLQDSLALLKAGQTQIVDITGTSQSALTNPNVLYYPHNAALTNITLPSSPVNGALVQVVGVGAGGWSVLTNGTPIYGVGVTATTSLSGPQRSTVTLRFSTVENYWSISSLQGTLTPL